MSSNLNGTVVNSIIDFDLIVNQDIGLIRFIRENFQDPKAFNLDILNKSDREILSLLYSREDFNPLSIITTEENYDDINDLYKSFMNKYKEEIIKRSTTEASIFKFINMVYGAGLNFGVSLTIAVNDDLEKTQISYHFEKPTFVYKNDKKTLCTADAYYIRNSDFFNRYGIEDDIVLKTIYMSPTKYNDMYLVVDKAELISKNQFVYFGKDYRNPDKDPRKISNDETNTKENTKNGETDGSINS